MGGRESGLPLWRLVGKRRQRLLATCTVHTKGIHAPCLRMYQRDTAAEANKTVQQAVESSTKTCARAAAHHTGPPWQLLRGTPCWWRRPTKQPSFFELILILFFSCACVCLNPTTSTFARESRIFILKINWQALVGRGKVVCRGRASRCEGISHPHFIKKVVGWCTRNAIGWSAATVSFQLPLGCELVLANFLTRSVRTL